MQSRGEKIDYRRHNIDVNPDKGQRAFSKDVINELANNMGAARSNFEGTFHDESFETERSAYYRTVIAHTIRYFKGGSIPLPETVNTDTYTVEQLKQQRSDYVDPFKVEYKILNQDILKTARDLAAEGKERHISVFNPENEDLVGGGAFDGAPNFEEDLFRVSNLCVAYVEHAREIGMKGGLNGKRPGYKTKLNDDQAHFTKDVIFIKEIEFPPGFHWYNKTFNILQPEKYFQCSVIGNAALSLNRRRFFSKDEREQTKERIRAHISSAVENNVTHPIFLDFGCGAFNNKPEEIAELYAEVLYDEGYAGFFQQVNFSIASPGNCKVFDNSFNNKIRQIRETRAIHVATRANLQVCFNSLNRSFSAKKPSGVARTIHWQNTTIDGNPGIITCRQHTDGGFDINIYLNAPSGQIGDVQPKFVVHFNPNTLEYTFTVNEKTYQQSDFNQAYQADSIQQLNTCLSVLENKLNFNANLQDASNLFVAYNKFGVMDNKEFEKLKTLMNMVSDPTLPDGLKALALSTAYHGDGNIKLQNEQKNLHWFFRTESHYSKAALNRLDQAIINHYNRPPAELRDTLLKQIDSGQPIDAIKETLEKQHSDATTKIDKEKQAPFPKRRSELEPLKGDTLQIRINKIVKLVSNDFEKSLKEAKAKSFTPEKIETIKFLKGILDSGTASNGLKAIAIDAATAGKAHQNQYLEKAIHDQYGADANKDNAITKILLEGIENNDTLNTIEDKIKDYVQDISTAPEPSPDSDGPPRLG